MSETLAGVGFSEPHCVSKVRYLGDGRVHRGAISSQTTCQVAGCQVGDEENRVFAVVVRRTCVCLFEKRLSPNSNSCAGKTRIRPPSGVVYERCRAGAFFYAKHRGYRPCKAPVQLVRLAGSLFLCKPVQRRPKPGCRTHVERKACTELVKLAGVVFLGKKLWRQPKTRMQDALGP